MTTNVYEQTLLDTMIRENPLNPEIVRDAAHELLQIIKEGLLRDGVVRISNFGTFRLKRVAARQGRNPQTGEPITIPARNTAVFTPAKALREMLEGPRGKPVPVTQTQEPKKPQTASAVASFTGKQSGGEEKVTETAPQQPPSNRGAYIRWGSAAAVVLAVVVFTLNSGDDLQQTQPAANKGVATTAQQAAPSVSTAEQTASVTQQEAKAPTTGETGPPPSETQVSKADTPTEQPQPTSMAAEESTTAEPTPAEPMVAEKPTTAEPSLDEPKVAVTEKSAVDIRPEQPSLMSSTKSVVEESAPQQPTAVATAETTGPGPFFPEQRYHVESGDNLWRLSDRFYTDPLLWPHIYQANAKGISNPDMLRSGRNITVPPLEGTPDNLTRTDRRGIAEGYYLAYLYYKETGHKDAFFALLEAKRYDPGVVEEKRYKLRLSAAEELLLAQQPVMPFH